MKRGIIIIIFWTIILIGLLLAPIRESQIPTFGDFKHWDKVAHFTLFAITGFVSVFGTSFFSQFRSRILFGIVFSLLLAVSTELAQSVVPLRNMSLYDLLADVVGLGTALSLYAFLYQLQCFRKYQTVHVKYGHDG